MPATAPLNRAETPEHALKMLPVLLPPVRIQDMAAVTRVGQMLYTPAVLPRWGDEIRHTGRVDADISVRNAARAAQLCAHNMIAVLRSEMGSLDEIRQVMQISVLVRCSDGFENLSRVADGASELLMEVFGNRGRHHRTVLPTGELPYGAVVQVSGIFRIS
jgi:enamine deaminase RidA (YjgF/YER057c/UK114 family)